MGYDRRPRRNDLTRPMIRSVKKNRQNTKVPMFSQSARTRTSRARGEPRGCRLPSRMRTFAVMFPDPSALTGTLTFVVLWAESVAVTAFVIFRR